MAFLDIHFVMAEHPSDMIPCTHCVLCCSIEVFLYQYSKYTKCFI